jgi:putative colanic acid biosynthesis acetyltransferase WcaF
MPNSLGKSQEVMSCIERKQIFDVLSHRANANYSVSENLRRLLWMLSGLLFAVIPRFAQCPKQWILRAFGAKVGRNVRIYSGVRIAQPWNLELGDEVTIGEGVRLYNLGRIEVQAGAMISQYAHLCAGTHDYTLSNMPLMKGGIQIGEGSWICAEAFIGPGCTIGPFSIVGARAVVLKSFPAFSIAGGNPASFIKPRPVPQSGVQIQS